MELDTHNETTKKTIDITPLTTSSLKTPDYTKPIPKTPFSDSAIQRFSSPEFRNACFANSESPYSPLVVDDGRRDETYDVISLPPEENCEYLSSLFQVRRLCNCMIDLFSLNAKQMQVS
jgi:hypothetical protein